MMRIAIIGGGLTGCTLARLLTDKGHRVTIFEKEPALGGLCMTSTFEGRPYQVYGPHNFHTNNELVVAFVTRFAQFNGYVHFKGTSINDTIVPYPISLETIRMLPQREQIMQELEHLPRDPDMANFETYALTTLGRTLYEMFIENYTQKFWGVSPAQLESDWAAKRIAIRTMNKEGCFGKEWQGLPVAGYTDMLARMTEGVGIVYNSRVTAYEELDHDLVISTMPLDELLHFRHGRLRYRGLRFETRFREPSWENMRFGCINFPGMEPAYIRKTNYNICYKNADGAWYIVGYEYPDREGRMYPLYDAANRAMLEKYIADLLAIRNVVSAGRLGLFRYYDMDEAIAWCLQHSDAIEHYRSLSASEREQLLR